ncbi:hypothetical protein OS493_001949 [Desmophyllum pertusum]|uniref:Uncharacterized protein n=1 Tax=Desmophyllum pertusum TaxID=174260 RepID=A0A9X0CTP9_9CNID|nr:hypothetical protein OS493_001949 [Desmophyllum pertusum]
MATAQAEGTDTSALFERLRKEAECLLCFRTVEEPKVLRCHHSFCLKCLNKRAMEAEKEGKSEINCIVCHSSVKIPRGGRFDDHRTSFYLNRLAEIVSIGVSNSKTQICWNCNESKTLQSYCFECEHFICRACEEYHKWDSLTHSHHTVLIRDLKEQDFDRIIRRPVMCEQKNHNKQSVEFYCHDCKVCICKLCVDELHDAHNIEGVEKASEQSKLNIMDNVQKLKTRLAECEEEVEKLQKGAVKREQNMSAIEDEIHKNVEEAILKLKLHEQEVLAKLDNLGNEQQSAFVAQQERNASRLTMLKDFLAYGENVLSNLSLPGLEEHYTIFKQFEQALDVDDDDDDDDSFNPPHVNYVPNKEFADIIKSVAWVKLLFDSLTLRNLSLMAISQWKLK